MNVDCFSSAEGRALVSPSAYRVFVQDAAWLRLDNAMCRSVLGDISAEEVAGWDAGEEVVFTRDQLDRVVLIHSIRVGLEHLFGCANGASEWLTLAHAADDPVFAGRTPSQHIVCEGMIGLYQVLKRIDALAEDITSALGDFDNDDSYSSPSSDSAWASAPRLLH